ncbi:MAG TPA: undecaprenyl-diphosphate phosphatase [Xenococcaceae cyanobacterium]
MMRFPKQGLAYWFFGGLGLLVSLLSLLVVSVSSVAATTELSTSTSQLNLLQAVVLGFVQGATEFIPISSTAHLKAVPVFLGWGDPGVAFSAIIQLGSIVAVLWYFWADLSQITQGMIRAIAKSDYESQDFWLAVGIAIGTIPILIIGLSIKAFVPDFDNSWLRSMTSIAIASIVMGLLLGLAESLGNQKRNFEDLTVKDGIIIGLAQALAIIPGVSRSGSTITAGLFYNLNRATAARFSFLLGIPAITLAGLLYVKDFLDAGVNNSELVPIIAGLISSAVFSYLAIAWLIKFLQKRTTWVFVWYRLGFGVFILITLMINDQ